MLVKLTSADTPPVVFWPTRQNWTSATRKTDVLAQPAPSLNGEQIVEQTPGLRAATLLTIARGNKSNALQFFVREHFDTAALCAATARARWTEDLPDGLTATLIDGAPGEEPMTCLFDNCELKSLSREIEGRSCVFGYTLVGGRIYMPDPPIVEPFTQLEVPFAMKVLGVTYILDINPVTGLPEWSVVT